ncbi:hypothetical protein DL93DRAFT_528119 [Clavulina sp. PMI_390]|nr:hypothetical protein DL93DRAFT_528119 [Clavulina sp. PMI_390]
MTRAKYTPLPIVDEELGIRPPPVALVPICGSLSLSRNNYIRFLYVVLFASTLFFFFCVATVVQALRKGSPLFHSSSPPSISTTFQAFRAPDAGALVNVTALNLALEVSRRIRSPPELNCMLREWHDQRYASIRAGGEQSRTVLIGLNIRNADEQVANIIAQLPTVIEFLGPQNVHMSVYESGSDDHTPKLLASLTKVLDALGTSYSIVSKGDTEHLNMEFDHRIESLAWLRNKLLDQLFVEDVVQSMPNGRFDEILFLNDIIWCPADLLEVIYQKRQTGAHQSCSVDWDWNMRVVYDRWVLRSISGRPWYDRENLTKYWHDPAALDAKVPPTPLPFEPEGRERFESLRPVQVFSCWNGMAAFTASAFVEKGIRFRVAENDHHGDGAQKKPTDIASECFLSSVDLWKAGMGKIVLASRARVAYGTDDYNIYRRDWRVGRVENLASLRDEERISWIEEPPKEVVLQDLGWWEDHERWAPWDEA